MLSILRSSREVLASNWTDLIRSRHSFVEDIESDLDESGMSNPSSVVTSIAFSLFVSLDFVHDSVVLGFIVLDRDLSSHSSNSSDSSSEEITKGEQNTCNKFVGEQQRETHL